MRTDDPTPLLHEDQRFEALARALGGPAGPVTFRTDAGGAVLEAPGWDRLTGQPQAASRDHGWQDMVHPEDRIRLAGAWPGSFAATGPVAVRLRVRTPSGSWRWLELRLAPVCDQAGEPMEWIGAALDIHDQQIAEIAVRDSEQRLRQLADTVDQVLYVTHLPDRRLLFISPSYERIWGRARAALLADASQFMAAIHPDDLARCQAQQRRQEAGQPVAIEYRIVRPDGQIRWIRDRAYPIRDPDGRVLRSVGVAEDVTEQRATEAALRSSEAQLRLATDAAEIGLWDVDVVSDTLFWPPRVKAMFGISPHVPVSLRDFYAGLHPEDRDRVAAAFEAALDPQRRAVYDVEYRTIGREDRIVRWVAAKGRGIFDADGRCVRVIGTAIDVTARRAAERRLRETETHAAEMVATLDALVANAPVGFAFFDGQHRYIRLNQVLADINGLPVEAHLGRPIEDVLPRNARVVGPAIDRVVQSGRVLEAVEIDGETPARPGETRSWLTNFFPVFGPAGGVALVGVTVTDITERRRAEAAVRELNDSLEAKVAERTAERDRLWRHSRDIQVVADEAGVMRAVSPAVTAILGWAPRELVGRLFLELVIPEDRAATEAGLASSADSSSPIFENRLTHKSGGHRFVSWVAGREEGLILASGRDVTAEREQALALAQAEEALRQAQKMEAVGQLTGGIAHDFNNLLQGLAGSLDLIRRRPDDGERVRRWAEAGLRAAERGAKLTGQLLAFSRAQRLELRTISLSRLLHGMRELLERTLGPAIEIRLELGAGEAAVLGDETQLELAILNLAINARDAMPDGGRLVLATTTRTADGEAFVDLSVTDTGMGMSSDVASRAFDPFFTTKGIGKGTGLGLSQVYGMIRQAGGSVRLESTPTRGTTVTMSLRASSAAVIEPQPETPDAAPDTANATTVLVVDDDPDVRRLLVESLASLGYAALGAQDGPAALEILQQTVPDAAILDYAMPGMTGAELAREMRATYPALPILFATGFADTEAIDAVAGPITGLLRKPFRIDDMRRALARLLDRDGAGPA